MQWIYLRNTVTWQYLILWSGIQCIFCFSDSIFELSATWMHIRHLVFVCTFYRQSLFHVSNNGRMLSPIWFWICQLMEYIVNFNYRLIACKLFLNHIHYLWSRVCSYWKRTVESVEKVFNKIMKRWFNKSSLQQVLWQKKFIRCLGLSYEGCDVRQLTKIDVDEWWWRLLLFISVSLHSVDWCNRTMIHFILCDCHVAVYVNYLIGW